MNIDYDKIADVAYLRLNKGKITKTTKMQDRLVIDWDKKGNIIGIEILDFSANKINIKNLEKHVREGVPVNITTTYPSEM